MNNRFRGLAQSAGFDLEQAKDQFNGHILPNSLDRYGQAILRECLEKIKSQLNNQQYSELHKMVEDHFDVKI